MNERRWCLSEFCIKHLSLCHCQVRMKGAHGHQWTRIIENLQMQTTITKSAFCQTLGRGMTTFEQAYLRKLCRRERGMGGNSSSVWFIETSTTSSFQKDIRIQAWHHLKKSLLVFRLWLESGSLYLTLSQLRLCPFNFRSTLFMLFSTAVSSGAESNWRSCFL